MSPTELAAARSLLGLNNEAGQFSLFFVYIIDLKKKGETISAWWV